MARTPMARWDTARTAIVTPRSGWHPASGRAAGHATRLGRDAVSAHRMGRSGGPWRERLPRHPGPAPEPIGSPTRPIPPSPGGGPLASSVTFDLFHVILP